MNGNNFESMIKKYADELIKMSRERTLPDLPEKMPAQAAEDSEEYEQEYELSPFPASEPRATVRDIPNIEKTDFYEETAEEITADEDGLMTDHASFSARVFAGNNAYPIEDAKVIIVKDDTLYTYLTTDRDGMTKKIRLPAYPEVNSLNPESDERAVSYTGEVYATGFTPKKGLLISAVGGSDIVLDVQMTPVSAR